MKPHKKHATKHPANRGAFLSSRGKQGASGAEIRAVKDGPNNKAAKPVSDEPFK
jgi:hypothetical protein